MSSPIFPIRVSRNIISTGFSNFSLMRLNLLLLSSILGTLVVLASAEREPLFENQVNRESILPNFVFLHFLIFAIKLKYLNIREKCLYYNTAKLNCKKSKKSLFYEHCCIRNVMCKLNVVFWSLKNISLLTGISGID